MTGHRGMTSSDFFTLIILVGGIALFYLVGIEIFTRSGRSRRFYGPKFRQNDLSDPAQQLSAVMMASFEKQRVMNAGEYRAFKIVEQEVRSSGQGFRVFAQTNLGEVLQSKNDDAFRSINSKRADIIIIDRGGWPVLAVEHQGKGHYQGKAAARDAVKKEALRKAGVGYVEVFEHDSEDQIRLRVRESLGWNVEHPSKPEAPVTMAPAEPESAAHFGRARTARVMN